MTKERTHGFKASIKLILIAVLSILSLIIFGTMSWVGTKAWTNYSTASGAIEFDASANRFIAGLYEVLLERLEVNNALLAAEPASPAVLAKISASRKIIGDNFDSGLAGIERREFPNKEALLQDLKTALQKANDHRRHADAAIKLPRDKRGDTLRKTFAPTITQSVNAGLKVWFAALYATAKHDPQLERLATIKEIGWRLRDYSGQERAIVASAIASGSAIPAEGWAAIVGHRARVAVLWDQLLNLTVDAGTDPAIIEAMRGAQQKYFQDFLSLSNGMKKLSDAGDKYPTNAAQWVDTTNPQIGALLEVLYAAAKVGETSAGQTANRSLRELFFTIGLLVFGLAISAVSIWTVIVRVTRPLSTISGVLIELANGNKAVDIPYTGRGDEIGA
ncbi:MAG TPA: hypothetical protein VII92_15830, partial [Anaerolineae bacterium]